MVSSRINLNFALLFLLRAGVGGGWVRYFLVFFVLFFSGALWARRESDSSHT